MTKSTNKSPKSKRTANAFFEGIKRGAEDAIAFAKGDKSRGRDLSPIDVKAVRAKTGLTQEQFAQIIAVPTPTLRHWEQERRSPTSSARALLKAIDAEPILVVNAIARANGIVLSARGSEAERDKKVRSAR